MSEALTQALARLADAWEVEAGPRGLTEWGKDLRRCAGDLRTALAGAAPTPTPETSEALPKDFRERLAVIAWHAEHDWPYIAIVKALRELLAASRGASEGSRGAAPTPPQDAR